ncbi:hypothetical protein HRbin17_02243 [bacterium HR17]|uniref:Uncharacterized protein n=1 Tax=Candidatus Fervidibacter japonicus TaxID=2035412 RepID=A0A2H5XEW1_9BACT|nr:hypothetical protein HRbin17_02243 [bacterium HR17]
MGFGTGIGGSGLGGKPLPGPAASSGWGRGQGPAPFPSEWLGQGESPQFSERVQLNFRTRSHALSGAQPVLPGPALSEEVLALPAPSGSGVPLSQVLPTYMKRAEQALSQQLIPPSERQRVRRYFEALQR